MAGSYSLSDVITFSTKTNTLEANKGVVDALRDLGDANAVPSDAQLDAMLTDTFVAYTEMGTAIDTIRTVRKDLSDNEMNKASGMETFSITGCEAVTALRLGALQGAYAKLETALGSEAEVVVELKSVIDTVGEVDGLYAKVDYLRNATWSVIEALKFVDAL
jgi:hypothetical protein